MFIYIIVNELIKFYNDKQLSKHNINQIFSFDNIKFMSLWNRDNF